MDIDSETERKNEKKRLKKEAKRKLEEAVVETTETEPEQEEESEEARKERKRAKKEAKRMRKETETVAEEVVAPVEIIAEAKVEKESKKTRKERNANAVFVPPPSIVKEVPADLSIQVYPEEDAHLYPPFNSFNDLYTVMSGKSSTGKTVLNTVQTYVTTKGFAKPSPIQSYCWPALFANKDLVGIAQTGSGKTLAFLLPALYRLEQLKFTKKINSSGNKPSPKILVVAPTRELAIQSYQVCIDVGIVSCICVYGGVSKHQQLADMKRLHSANNGLDIVIATPGRLLDFIQDNAMSLSGIH